MTIRRTVFATLVSSLITGQALAHNHHDESEYRQHGAHVHGVVELNIAQDANALLVEITAPGADVVGFEHAPKNDEQKKALDSALKTLAQPLQLLTFSTGAQCTLVDTLVTETLTAHDDKHAHHDHDSHDHDEHAHHDHDSHDHDEHAHHDHDSHDHDEHAHHDHDSHDHDCNCDGQHGEFSAQYTFNCDNIETLTDMQSDWFKHFTSTEKITIQAITNKGQKAGQLTPAQTQFTF
ncbi:zinc uptake protein ZrgA [Photobacterium kagoshimensis]|uniref:zinc uptake protein ZrgA n=1 Tax=Photobacterium kagoshimensis TaxID=2910242 RepID=UPI003D0D4133